MFVQIVFASLLLLLLGLGLCFAGFRLFVILLPMFGFFAGFLVTAQAIQELFGGGFLSTASSWVFGIIIGVVCAVAAYFFYYAAVAVLAATVRFEFGVGIVAGLGVSSGVLQFIVGLVVAAVLTATVILLNLPQVFIVVLTALAGASMILTGVLLTLGRVSLATLSLGVVGAFIRDSWFWWLAYLTLVVVGVAAQMLLPEEYIWTPYSRERMGSYTPNTQGPASPPKEAGPTV